MQLHSLNMLGFSAGVRLSVCRLSALLDGFSNDQNTKYIPTNCISLCAITLTNRPTECAPDTDVARRQQHRHRPRAGGGRFGGGISRWMGGTIKSCVNVCARALQLACLIVYKACRWDMYVIMCRLSVVSTIDTFTRNNKNGARLWQWQWRRVY